MHTMCDTCPVDTIMRWERGIDYWCYCVLHMLPLRKTGSWQQSKIHQRHFKFAPLTQKKSQKYDMQVQETEKWNVYLDILVSMPEMMTRRKTAVSPHQLWASISGEVQLHSCLSVHHDLPRPTSLIGFLVVEKLNIILNRISDIFL